jgi:hypothetical protein
VCPPSIRTGAKIGTNPVGFFSDGQDRSDVDTVAIVMLFAGCGSGSGTKSAQTLSVGAIS